MEVGRHYQNNTSQRSSREYKSSQFRQISWMEEFAKKLDKEHQEEELSLASSQCLGH